jgi:alcohol dehydrogenase (NADP+)
MTKPSAGQIDPASVPSFTLSTGDRIPSLGLGTFGSDAVPPATVAETVRNAVHAGYRHIDCASVYANENQVGTVLTDIFSRGAVARGELWITSKVWNDMHGRVGESCRNSLHDLHLDYLDLFLVHWPFPNYHPPKCDVTMRNPNARPYIHEEFMRTWEQMERLVDEGLVRNIGTSNMTIPKMELVLRDARIRPVCNEMELHPHFQQPELFGFCVRHGVQPIAYCPMGSPGRPERDRTADDTVDLEDPVLVAIAQRSGVSPAQVALRWAIQRGQIPIPFSVNHFAENLQTAVLPPLDEEDMEQLSRIDRNCRLVKGQVFLWKDGQTWEDLWDGGGIITPA